LFICLFFLFLGVGGGGGGGGAEDIITSIMFNFHHPGTQNIKSLITKVLEARF